MKTFLSVNINKIATLRNSRGGDIPNLLQFAIDCEKFGADGITVHPRPDERHIKYKDVYELKKIIKGEFNIEGNPKEKKFIDLVLEIKPNQVTLVPDDINALTSNKGWDCIKNQKYLEEIITIFKTKNIRTSIFIDPILEQIQVAKKINTDRIELYTEEYAKNYKIHKKEAIIKYKKVAEEAKKLNIGINAGHDLNLENIEYLKNEIPYLKEVSIGHALISEALYLGIENTIQLYQQKLKQHYN